MTSTLNQVTQRLQQWSDGDQNALNKLMPLVDEEFHQLAHEPMRRESGLSFKRQRYSRARLWSVHDNAHHLRRSQS
jgi:hypothetical protein